jgi:xanthine/uracil permease
VELGKVNFGMRESFVIGIATIIGCGVMFLPATAFLHVPQTLRYVISNGQLVGTLIAIFLNLLLVGLKQPDEKIN